MKAAVAQSHSMEDLAARISGAELAGNPAHRVSRFVHPNDVSGPGDLSLVMSSDLRRTLGKHHHCAVVDRELVESDPSLVEEFESCLIVERPRYVLAELTRLFPRQPKPAPGIHPTAVIEDGAEIGEGCAIGPNAWIGAGAMIGNGTVVRANASIGEGVILGEVCLIHCGVYIGDGVLIGNGVIIHPNAVIGADGFAFNTANANNAEAAKSGYIRSEESHEPLARIDSLGTVRIEDDVEIGACTTSDRSTLGETLIGRGTKIDNLVQIGHGNQIGSDTLFCSQVGLAGSSKIGNGVVLAGKVGIADHRTIGDNAVLMAKSGVTKDVPPGEVYYGMPAQPVKNTLRNYSLINRLTEMRKQIADLEAAVSEQSDSPSSREE